MTDNQQDQNRRAAQRKEAAFSLYYSIEVPIELRITLGIPDEVTGIMMDLSELGTAIITQYDIPAKTLLRIRFTLFNNRLSGENRSRKIHLMAEVMSNQILPDDGHRLGLRFDKISQEDKTAINEFVKSVRA